MYRHILFSFIFLGCTIASSSVKASGQRGTMEEIFDGTPATTTSGAQRGKQTLTPNHPIVQAALDNLPKGGLENVPLECRIVPIYGGKEKKRAIEIWQQIIEAKNDEVTICKVSFQNQTINNNICKSLENIRTSLKKPWEGNWKKSGCKVALQNQTTNEEIRTSQKKGLEGKWNKSALEKLNMISVTLTQKFGWCKNFIDVLQTSFADAIEVAKQQKNDLLVDELNERKEKISSLTAAWAVGNLKNDVEPRLWQMNYPKLNQVLGNKKFFFYEAKVCEQKDGACFSDAPALKAYYIKDASLHLDFMLLNNKVVGAVQGQDSSLITDVSREALEKHVKEARQACASWDIPDAWSRKTPHNFRDVVVLFGDYEVIFRDGQVSAVKQISRSLDQPAPQETVAETGAQVVPEATESPLHVTPQPSAQSVVPHTTESGSLPCSLPGWLSLILNPSDEQVPVATAAHLNPDKGNKKSTKNKRNKRNKRKSPENASHPPEQEGSASKKATVEGESTPIRPELGRSNSGDAGAILLSLWAQGNPHNTGNK